MFHEEAFKKLNAARVKHLIAGGMPVTPQDTYDIEMLKKARRIKQRGAK